MAVDVPWAVNELRIFVELVGSGSTLPAAGDSLDDMVQTGAVREAGIVTQAPVAEGILDRVTPGWRTTVLKPAMSPRWARHKEAALRAITVLEREAELREHLGDDAPTLSAGALHPWVWEGARSLWASGHHAEAVAAAARKLNAETQNKVGRRDISETDLFNQAFNDEDPAPGKARLRLAGDDGGRTAKSLRRGVRAFAEGRYAALRNPAAHDVVEDLPEHEALEQLAAFSVLARWVQRAEVVTAP